MLISLNFSKKLISLFTFFTLLILTSCGEVPSSLDGYDELESITDDQGLNQDLSDDQAKACLGKVITVSSDLNIRTAPEISDNVCGTIPSQSYLTLLSLEEVNGFLPVKSDFCTNEETQYVSANFIEAGEDCFDSPEVDEPIEQKYINDLGSYIESNFDFVSTYRPLVRGGATGLVEVYKVPGRGENIMCGMKHIRSYRAEPYQGKDTLCAWTAVAQEWRQKHCPDNSPHCRIMMGDTSFGERMPSSWPHSTHRRGWCMDIWPMRKQGCDEKEVTWRQSCYDQDLTKDFIKLLIKHGADKGNQLFFNDPEIPDVRYLSNHDDHIHACFKPSNNIVKTRCDSTVVDSKICPEFFK